MSSTDKTKSTQTDISNLQGCDANSALWNEKKERILTYHLLSHQLRVASCREFFSEILIFAKKEMLVTPCPETDKIQKLWAARLDILKSKEDNPPSVDLENCDLDLELYVGYRTLQRELEGHLVSMAEIQLKIATEQCKGNCIKAIVLYLVGRKKYDKTFMDSLRHPKCDASFRRKYRKNREDVYPNGFTTGGCKLTMEKARVEIERVKNKYSYI